MRARCDESLRLPASPIVRMGMLFVLVEVAIDTDAHAPHGSICRKRWHSWSTAVILSEPPRCSTPRRIWRAAGQV